MSTTICYSVSEAVQNAEIAAGRDGSRDREIVADMTSLINHKACSVNPDDPKYNLSRMLLEQRLKGDLK